jgi:hypothetical protein
MHRPEAETASPDGDPVLWHATVGGGPLRLKTRVGSGVEPLDLSRPDPEVTKAHAGESLRQGGRVAYLSAAPGATVQEVVAAAERVSRAGLEPVLVAGGVFPGHPERALGDAEEPRQPLASLGGSGLGGLRGLGGIGGLKDSQPRNAGTVRLGGSNVLGSCRPDAVRRVVMMRAGAIRACYERQLQIHTGLSGKVSTRWTIDLQGEVQSAAVTASTLGNASVEGCLLRALRRMRFPRPEGGPCIVNWPFVFQPGR